MRTILVLLATVCGISTASAQECPNGVCPPNREASASEVAKEAITAVVLDTFRDVSDISFDVGLRTGIATLADTSASLLLGYDLSYEHVSIAVQLDTGVSIECRNATVTTPFENPTKVLGVSLGGCVIE